MTKSRTLFFIFALIIFASCAAVGCAPISNALFPRAAFAASEGAAEFNKGMNYFVGQNGVAQDYAEAMKWLRDAADKGNDVAMYNIGVLYEEGLGVAKDPAEAMKWYRKAAHAGNAIAVKNVGRMYENGIGVSVDYGEAMTWYRAAAMNGEPNAMNAIGNMYEAGRGVAVNYDEALEWYKKGAERRNKPAMENLETLQNNLKYGFDRPLLVVIDAGHQKNANYEKEPIGPGAKESKIKVSAGTKSIAGGFHEYELNLLLALGLQKELEGRGYRVLMTRTTNEVNISNSERAAVANHARADAFVRIHANASPNPAANGAMTICQTKDNPYNGALYAESKTLATCILERLVRSTNCKKLEVWETDSMSGINWCKVPATIVEVGFMTNLKEDALLAASAYQNKIITGIADGIDLFIDSRAAAR